MPSPCNNTCINLHYPLSSHPPLLLESASAWDPMSDDDNIDANTSIEDYDIVESTVSNRRIATTTRRTTTNNDVTLTTTSSSSSRSTPAFTPQLVRANARVSRRLESTFPMQTSKCYEPTDLLIARRKWSFFHSVLSSPLSSLITLFRMSCHVMLLYPHLYCHLFRSRYYLPRNL